MLKLVSSFAGWMKSGLRNTNLTLILVEGQPRRHKQKLPQSDSLVPTWDLCGAKVVVITVHLPAGVPLAFEEQRGDSVTMFAKL